MPPELSSPQFDNFNRAIEPVRLLEIVGAANTSRTVGELAARCLEALRAIHAYHLGFFLVIDPELPRLVLEQARGISPELEDALRALTAPSESGMPDSAVALEDLCGRVRHELAARGFTAPVLIPLVADGTGVGLIAISGEPELKIQTTWENFKLSADFSNVVSTQVGTALHRVMAQTKGRASEEWLRAFLDQIQDGFWETDGLGRVTRVNQAALDTLQRPREQVVGKRIDELSDADPERLRELRELIARDGIVRDFIFQVRASTGELRTIRETVRTTRDERGKIIAHQGIFRDITAQQETIRALAQRNHERELLHELATRLNNLIGKQEALDVGLDLIMELTHADAVGIMLINNAEGRYDMVAHRGLESELLEAYGSAGFDRGIYEPGYDADKTSNLIEYIVLTRGTLTLQDSEVMSRFDLKPLADFGYNDFLASPIKFEKQVFGIVMLGAKTNSLSDEHTIKLVDSISAQLGLTLHNQELFSTLERRIRQIEAVARTGRLIEYAPNAREELPKVAREMRQVFGAGYVVIHLLRENYFEYVTASDTRELRRRFPISAYERRMLDSQEPLLIQDRDAPAVDPEQRKILETLKMRASMGVRLYARDHPIGLVFVNQEAKRIWQAEEEQLLLTFAQQIAYALENKRLLDEVSQQLSELRALARVGRMIATAQHTDRALYSVADEIAHVFGADYVSFHLREGQELHLVAESKHMDAPHRLPIQPYQHRILEELDPVCVNNSETDALPVLQREFLSKYQIVADLGVPLVSGQKAMGILYICQHTPRAWTEAQVQLAETFAQQIAGALTQERLLRETTTQVRYLRALARSAHLIAHSRSPEHALPNAAQDLRRFLDTDYVGFHLLDGDKFHIITEPQHGLARLEYPVLAYHAPMIQYMQKIVIHDRDLDAKDATYRAVMVEYGFRAEVAVPMIARGKTIGVLFVSQRTPRHWHESEINLIDSYAQHIATVLENVQLLNEKEKRVRELAQLAELNDLTTTIPVEQVLIEMAFGVLKPLLNADRVVLALFRDGEVRALHSSDGVIYPEQPMPMTPEFQELLRTRLPRIVDPNHPPKYDGDFQARAEFHQIKSVLAVPLVSAAKVIGSLGFLFTSEHVFVESEVRLAQSAGNQLAMAFANARLLRDQETRIERLTELSRFGMWCSTLRDSKTLEREAVERIRALLDVQGVSIRFEEDGILTVGTGTGYAKPELRDHTIRIDNRLQSVLQQKKPYPITNLSIEPDVPEHWRTRHLQEGFMSLLMVPMLAEHQVLGILSVFRTVVHKWDDSEIQYAQTVATTLALAISNARQIEKAQHQSDELSATLDSVFSGVFAADANGAIRGWNRAAEQITGFTSDEMIGKLWHVDGPRVGISRKSDDIILEALTEGKVQFSLATRHFKRADGVEIQLREAVAPLRDGSGNIRGAVCAFWDRTQEQAAERAKADFINLVGHQLNNKVGALLWSAQGLSRAGLSDKSRARFTDIISDTRRELEAFNKQFNEFRQEHLRDGIEESQLDLEQLLRKKIATWRATCPDHHFRTTGRFDRVLGEELRLDVVLDNLLENACKYSPPGSWIVVRGRFAGPGALVLSIHNKGKPIPADLQPHLFDRGQRGDSEQPGTGLGLWLVRTKLNELGGDIRVESSARKGTTFYLTLRRPVPPSPPGAAAQGDASPNESTRGAK